MAKYEFYMGAAKSDDVTGQDDVQAVEWLIHEAGAPTFLSVAAIKEKEADGWEGKVRYIRVTVEEVDE